MFKKKSNRNFGFSLPVRQKISDRLARAGIFLVVAFCVAGCNTIKTWQPVDLSDNSWNLRQGQAVWSARRGAPEIAGDLLVATNAEGRAVVQFTKTPLPFLVAQSTTNSWQLHSVPDNRTFSGHGQPPVRAIWLWLPRCLAGDTPHKPLMLERRENDNWRLQNEATGEFLEGYLSP